MSQAKAPTVMSIRIAEILNRLNQGEVLFLNDLVNEFTVSKRTIQRDLHEKLSFLPYEQDGQKIWLDSIHLGQLNLTHLQRFVSHLQLSSINTKWSTSIIQEMMQPEPSWLVMPFESEKVTSLMQQAMTNIKKAIVRRQELRFQYQSKNYTGIQPYRLLFYKGMWYLAAFDVQADKLKTFRLSRIKLLGLGEKKFELNKALNKQVSETDTIWIGSSEIQKVVLKIDAEVSDQFKTRNIIPNQVVEKELGYDGIIVSCKVRHYREILPIIQYWLPYVSIISPEPYRAELREHLQLSLKVLEGELI